MSPIESEHNYSFKKQFEYIAAMNPFFEYASDRLQRTVMFVDLWRQHGNEFFKDFENGQPPVLSFKYEVIMDGRTFDKPVNYALTKIVERRKVSKRASSKLYVNKKREQRKNENGVIGLASSEEGGKRPVIIIDPRSGNAPGIAGSKKNSEIGIAIQSGLPVYYIIFFPEPEKDQTLEDVKNAEIKFIEEVKKLHPDAPKPAVIGNSQAGWALALLNAEEPDLAGPMILNGAPISYWAGKQGKHVMRYRTAIMGGSWLVSLLSDLGNGLFDGAYLVSGYEAVDPCNTFLRKPYKLFINIDRNHKSYLKFERWWSSYYMMTEEEIIFIADKLFIENSLEKGELGFEGGKKIDLKDLRDPVVVFASGADNITPPQQALNWITKVWESVDEIKNQNQTIVYMVHDNIRHMGIFISDKIAVKEHKGIIQSVDKLGYLAPGLYEMVIEKDKPGDIRSEHAIRFESRNFDDILSMADSTDDELDFYPAVAVSAWNKSFYEQFLRPFVRSFINKQNSSFIKMHNPQRVFRYIFSDMNPYMVFFKISGNIFLKNRFKASRENPYVLFEEKLTDLAGEYMDFQREWRDIFQENIFRQIYGNPFLRFFFKGRDDMDKKITENNFDRLMEKNEQFKGGFPEAAIRIMMAVAAVDNVFHEKEIETIINICTSNTRLQNLDPEKIRALIQEQSGILNYDSEGAIESLPFLIKTREERIEAIGMAKKIASSDLEVSSEENQLITKLMDIFELKD